MQNLHIKIDVVFHIREASKHWNGANAALTPSISRHWSQYCHKYWRALIQQSASCATDVNMSQRSLDQANAMSWASPQVALERWRN